MVASRWLARCLDRRVRHSFGRWNGTGDQIIGFRPFTKTPGGGISFTAFLFFIKFSKLKHSWSEILYEFQMCSGVVHYSLMLKAAMRGEKRRWEGFDDATFLGCQCSRVHSSAVTGRGQTGKADPVMYMVKVGGGPVCRSVLPGQLPVLPFICSQATSISQVVQGLGVLSTWVHFQAPAGKAAPSML